MDWVTVAYWPPAFWGWPCSCSGSEVLAATCSATSRWWAAIPRVSGRCCRNVDGGAGLPQAVCERGDAQCRGAALQICMADGAGWVTRQACESAALCVVDEGTVSTCDGAQSVAAARRPVKARCCATAVKISRIGKWWTPAPRRRTAIRSLGLARPRPARRGSSAVTKVCCSAAVPTKWIGISSRRASRMSCASKPSRPVRSKGPIAGVR